MNSVNFFQSCVGALLDMYSGTRINGFVSIADEMWNIAAVDDVEEVK